MLNGVLVGVCVGLAGTELEALVLLGDANDAGGVDAAEIVTLLPAGLDARAEAAGACGS